MSRTFLVSGHPGIDRRAADIPITLNSLRRCLRAGKHEISVRLATQYRIARSAAAINLISPDGNQYLFSRQTNGTLTNSSMPSLQGVVMTTNSSGQTIAALPRWNRLPVSALRGGLLSQLHHRPERQHRQSHCVPLNATVLRITQVTDPVGRSLNLTYNSTRTRYLRHRSDWPKGLLHLQHERHAGNRNGRERRRHQIPIRQPEPHDQHDRSARRGDVSEQLRRQRARIAAGSSPMAASIQFAYTLANPRSPPAR
jgi:hypothetical protein